MVIDNEFILGTFSEATQALALALNSKLVIGTDSLAVCYILRFSLRCLKNILQGL